MSFDRSIRYPHDVRALEAALRQPSRFFVRISRTSVIAIGLIAILIVIGTLVRVRFINEFADKPLSEIETQQGIVAHQLRGGRGLSYDEALELMVNEIQAEQGGRVDLEDIDLPDARPGTGLSRMIRVTP